jgi:hypothetical protein
MSLKDDVEKLKEKVDKDFNIDNIDNNSDEKKVLFKLSRKKKRIPLKYRSIRKYKDGKILVLFCGYNHFAKFVWGIVDGGLIKILHKKEVKTYNAYEEGAIYFLKKYPFAIVFEWRLTPVGGKAEELTSRVVGGDVDKAVAEEFGLSNFAQQTIIRAIKHEEIIKDEKPKKSFPPALIILLVGIVLFILGKAFGVV